MLIFDWHSVKAIYFVTDNDSNQGDKILTSRVIAALNTRANHTASQFKGALRSAANPRKRLRLFPRDRHTKQHVIPSHIHAYPRRVGLEADQESFDWW
jgi:hypothetical protein